MGSLNLYAHPNKLHYVPDGPLIVSLYGGPGTGKSTTAAMLFAALKMKGYNAELVTEYAKDLTWEKRGAALGNQPYVTSKQIWHLDRLRNQVETIVTDTSTLLALIYGEDKITPAFRNYVLDDHARRHTLNVFLRRDPERPYNPKGRRQSQESAEALDTRILKMLAENRIDHYTVYMKQDGSHLADIVGIVEEQLT